MVSTRKQAARSPSPPLAFKQGDAAATAAVAHAPSNAAVATPGGKASRTYKYGQQPFDFALFFIFCDVSFSSVYQSF